MLDGGPVRKVFRGRIEPAGLEFDAPPGLPLLLAAAAAGIEMPSSCRNGSCRTCISRLVAGRILYRIEWPGLLAEEKAQGLVLPCVAYPCTDVVLRLPPG